MYFRYAMASVDLTDLESSCTGSRLLQASARDCEVVSSKDT